jgi:hypothetical protein
MSVWGSLLLHVHYGISKIILPGLLRVFIEGFSRMNWLVCLFGGTLMSPLFLVRGWERAALVQ